jgi:predicted SnoaL-like aldol condensation-catalyzing enzyme
LSAQERKKIVKKIFEFIMQERPKDSLPYFAQKCKQHNPYVKGGMDALFDSMAAVQQEPPKFSDPYFSIKRIIADGNMMAAHTEMLFSNSKPREGGLR